MVRLSEEDRNGWLSDEGRKEIPPMKRIEEEMRVERIQGTKMMNSANGYNIVISAASYSVDLD